ncbi:hypothetical protein EDEG_02776 [Edhazardia aedis USNM 41457]|uniref:Helicase ATP-binding domain-containing protein n=1 Tax=Edhazardia aedis (strain USNM 41457) TaxID=1003232 RepID=J9DJN4_EDHAE|nr:hypothetical protein EDEG_02776 [Edhazardia aedis USNM 41457]|eukprot:EJW02835.1 hypothetical protein EDEG_02776 [Edhazardia aedis USNM 41457]
MRKTNNLNSNPKNKNINNYTKRKAAIQCIERIKKCDMLDSDDSLRTEDSCEFINHDISESPNEDGIFEQHKKGTIIEESEDTYENSSTDIGSSSVHIKTKINKKKFNNKQEKKLKNGGNKKSNKKSEARIKRKNKKNSKMPVSVKECASSDIVTLNEKTATLDDELNEISVMSSRIYEKEVEFDIVQREKISIISQNSQEQEVETETWNSEIKAKKKVAKLDMRHDFYQHIKSGAQTVLRQITPFEHKKISRFEKEEKNILEIHKTLPEQEEMFINALPAGFTILEQPKRMLTKLMDYQLYGVSWMKSREDSIVGGGILADEMGMGKTLQALGLMLCDEPSKLTLIIAPAISINQWIQEMHKHVPNTFNIINYHGRLKKDKESLEKLLKEHNFTHQTEKDKLENSGNRNTERKNILDIAKDEEKIENVSNIMICSNQANDNSEDKGNFFKKHATPNTLNSPIGNNFKSNVLSNSKNEEIPSKKERKKQPNSNKNARDDVNDDSLYENKKLTVIITTYGTIESDYRRKEKFLFSKRFYRIILDEAHSIKDSKSSTCTAVGEINAEKRWGLTGTPVQNRVGDLYSLVKFLKLDPHSYYFCKKCECKTNKWLNYHLRDPNIHRNGFCTCGHFSASHFGWWNRRITSQVKSFAYTEKGNEIFENLKKITSHILLRRTKNNLEKELGLPSKTVYILRNYFSPQEKDFYESLYKRTQTKFMDYAIAGQVKTNYAHIFDLLQKMRLAVNHPYLAMKNVNDGIPICGFCNEEANDPIMSKCRHIFCREEAREFLQTSNLCPVCKVKITIDLNQEKEIVFKKSKINTDNWTSSTKIECLVEELS